MLNLKCKLGDNQLVICPTICSTHRHRFLKLLSLNKLETSACTYPQILTGNNGSSTPNHGGVLNQNINLYIFEVALLSGLSVSKIQASEKTRVYSFSFLFFVNKSLASSTSGVCGRSPCADSPDCYQKNMNLKKKQQQKTIISCNLEMIVETNIHPSPN